MFPKRIQTRSCKWFYDKTLLYHGPAKFFRKSNELVLSEHVGSCISQKIKIPHTSSSVIPSNGDGEMAGYTGFTFWPVNGVRKCCRVDVTFHDVGAKTCLQQINLPSFLDSKDYHMRPKYCCQIVERTMLRTSGNFNYQQQRPNYGPVWHCCAVGGSAFGSAVGGIAFGIAVGRIN